MHGAGDHWRVVGAVDGDRHVLGDGGQLVVGDRDREGLGVGFTLGQVLVAGVVQRVGPRAAAGVDREAAVGASGIARVGGRGAGVHVAGGDAARRGERGVFRHRAGLHGAGDHWCVVGAGDGHVYSAGNGTAVSVQHIKAEGFNLDLTLSQILDCRSTHAVIPGNDTASAAARGVIADAGRQAAQCIRRRYNNTDAVRVSKVYISKPNRATVSEHKRGLRNMQLIAKSSTNGGVWIISDLNEVGAWSGKYI